MRLHLVIWEWRPLVRQSGVPQLIPALVAGGGGGAIQVVPPRHSPARSKSARAEVDRSKNSVMVGFTPTADCGSVPGGKIVGYQLRYAQSVEDLLESRAVCIDVQGRGPGGLITGPPIEVCGLLAGDAYFCQVAGRAALLLLAPAGSGPVPSSRIAGRLATGGGVMWRIPGVWLLGEMWSLSETSGPTDPEVELHGRFVAR